MRTLLATLVVPAVFGLPVHAIPVQYFFAVHSEEPSVPDTPNFQQLSTPQSTYVHWRDAILEFAEVADEYGIKWSFQSDWNFLEGIRRFEVPGRPGFDASLLLTASDGTGGLNLAQYLAKEYGVELDPHSHESGVNYADVDWLLRVGLSAPSSGVVGGHVNDATDTAHFQNWPKFIADPRGLEASQHAGHFWKPTLLMGGGPAAHQNEYHASGVWRPADANNYYSSAESATAQPLVSCGQWFNDLHEHWKLIRRVSGGALPGGQRIYTCGIVMNHRDIANDATYTQTKARAVMATIKAWQDAGLIENRHYEELIPLWESAASNSTPNIHMLPDDTVQFTLNWQDHARPDLSAATLRTILDAHEAAGVPLDVSFTTWQTDDIAAVDPGLFGRLQSSAMAVMAYHVRPPLPYANSFLRGPLNGSTMTTAQRTAYITNYESRKLNLVTGEPDASISGGYDKLRTLMGYSPLTVGAQPDTEQLRSIAHGVFRTMGAGFMVSHLGITNLGDRIGTATGTVYKRPETLDWKLIALWENNPSDPQPGTLTAAMAGARAKSGAKRPYFTGVKLHDNDAFHDQSWWSLVYPPGSRLATSWNPNQSPNLLTSSEQEARLTFYLNLVSETAARYLEVNAVNSRDFWPMLENVVPVRPAGLTRTSGDECAEGTELGELTGGGIQHGVGCTWSLVSGDGDLHNADFAISGYRLLAARALDYESGGTRRLRVRWQDASGSSGERALTYVIRNITADDDDSDGATEAEEVAAGTDPRDGRSVFRVSAVTRTAGGALEFSFASVAGRSYQLWSSTDLVTWTAESGVAAAVSGTGGIVSVRDVSAAPVRKYYRVVVTP